MAAATRGLSTRWHGGLREVHVADLAAVVG
jgi:hypothetical protein